jgi:signal transduction histidine kinase
MTSVRAHLADRHIEASWTLIVLAVVMLLMGVGYTLVYVLWTPYPGVDYDASWQVIAFDMPCAADPDWCTMRDDALQIGDQLLKIGDLTFDAYRTQPTLVAFTGYHPGDRVPITLVRDGETRHVVWQMLGPTGNTYFIRLIGFLIFLPFWLAGTIVLLFLRPRDQVWRLLIAFNYVTAIWIAAGIPSATHSAYSVLVLRFITWMMLAVYLDLHMLVPSPVLTMAGRHHWSGVLYAVCIGMAIAGVFNLIPGSVNNLALLGAVASSLSLLIYRLFRPLQPATQLALRLMLWGNALAFGPGLALYVIPTLTESSLAGRVPIIVMMVAISMQPFFYIYALYKNRLGELEFRANRLLSLFAFLTLYVTVFLFAFLAGSRWVNFTSQTIAFSLIMSVIFITGALFLHPPFQRLIDRLAYGTEHSANDIIRAFANQIPRALNRDALVGLLTHEVAPSLLIRRSALYLTDGPDVTLLYADGVTTLVSEVVSDEAAPIETLSTGMVSADVAHLLAHAGVYRPPEPNQTDAFAWVRLALPITVSDKVTGVWLLGKRDPDDYYPRPDIELLATIANQIGVALENTRLFENLQRRAAELERAYHELQDLDRIKDEFVQNVSHELRTPLAIIQTSGEVLLEDIVGELNPEQRTIIDRLTVRTRGMIRLVNDILTIQKASIEHLDRVPLDLAVLAQSHLAEIALVAQQPEYAGANFHFAFDTDMTETIPLIGGDAGRLGQVIDNLLNNALKFSPQGGTITVSVRARKYRFEGPDSESPQPAVEVGISDEGIGIPTAELDHIWTRFYQVDGSSTRRFGGTGLGLAIARTIIKAHGGDIWAESAEGCGSVFRFVLPALAAASPSSQNAK